MKNFKTFTVLSFILDGCNEYETFDWLTLKHYIMKYSFHFTTLMKNTYLVHTNTPQNTQKINGV